MEWKPILVPLLTYDAIKAYAKAHNLTIAEAAQHILFEWTLRFWSDPSRFGVDIHSED